MSRFDECDITDDAGAIVISIETLRRARRPQPPAKECQHARISIAEKEADVVCRDCGVRLNPIAWIAWAATEWVHIQRMYKAYRAEEARLALRCRVRCTKCGETIRLLGRSEDERARRQSREARMEEALEHIAALGPEAAQRSAAEIARKALAARDGSGDAG